MLCCQMMPWIAVICLEASNTAFIPIVSPRTTIYRSLTHGVMHNLSLGGRRYMSGWKPIMGVSGWSPQRGPGSDRAPGQGWGGLGGIAPWSWNTFSFWTFDGSSNFAHFCEIWQRRKPADICVIFAKIKLTMVQCAYNSGFCNNVRDSCLYAAVEITN